MHGADGRTGGEALTKRSGERADKRTGQKGSGRSSGRGRKGCGEWSGRADGAHEARTERSRRGRADGRTGSTSRADGRTGVLVVRRSGGLAHGRTGRRAGGPGFKRPHSTRPTSLLGA